jgi:hypothetical protein
LRGDGAAFPGDRRRTQRGPKKCYRRVLAASVLIGLGIGYATAISEGAIAILTAILVGGVILNVLKEAVPSERQSRFWGFAAGTAGYPSLMLAL